MPHDDAFLQHLLATFRVEADEHLAAMTSLVLELEQAVPAERLPQLVETLFREAHSLKGAARSVGLGEIEAACADLEGKLAALKQQEVEPSPALFAMLDRGMDELARLLVGGDVASPPAVPLSGLSADRGPPRMAARAAPAEPSERPERRERRARAPGRLAEAGETVRISTAKLAALLVQTEELLSFKHSVGHLVGELRAVEGEVADWKKACAKRSREVGALRRGRAPGGNGRGERHPQVIDKLCDAVEGDALFAKSLHDRLARLHRVAEQERRALGGIVDGLQDDMKRALMQPFAALLELLPKLVRDLARDGGKEAELRVEGAAIEIDRRILEQMKDPLIHLARNAIDHGIEPPAERLRRGKARQGHVAITITPKEGNQVEILFADDGAGVELDKVSSAALRQGLVIPEDAGRVGRQELLALLFESGLSTSARLTDISGRGLGLAIVREKVEKLGGSVGIETPPGGGTSFRIVLPTTLANFRGVLVALGDRQFVLPSRNVERVARIAVDSIRTVENREAIELAGQAVALVRLSEILALPAADSGAGGDAAQDASERLSVAVLASAGKRIAFAVDAVLGDQEVLVKGLGPQLQRVRFVAGATVLGAGTLVPILSVPDLFIAALSAKVSRRPGAAAGALHAPAARRSLLVVEDSITSRALLKNILESAGYAVTTAVDGVDALTLLRTGPFDLVVSDVEMPRMDGFDLTARIRQDKKLAELPVVLVTALESRQHKERGIDVGANAYLVKSSFDQSNLLEVIRRLI
jgi:two-component system, chemotaxis family, sensor kinase CheA